MIIFAPVKIKEVVEALERFAPLPLQEDYDNAGLQIGLTEADISGALLCLDVTEAVIAEAVSRGCNLIVAHHPLLFRGIKCVADANDVQRCVRQAIKHDICIYAAHTNLDNAPGGVNFAISEKLGLENVTFLLPRPDGKGGSGLIGDLKKEMPAADFLKTVKETFHIACLMHNDCQKPVRRVALCGGAGEFLMNTAVSLGADAFLTGEIGYHYFFGHEQEILIGAMGHYQSEQFTIDLLEKILSPLFAENKCPLLKTGIDTNPIHYLV